MSELIQYVDENDNPIGVGTTENALANGIYHRIVRVILFDENNRILSQKRSANKKLCPNMWTDSASGHVDAGEEYMQAARRELKEELGIETDLKFVTKFQTNHLNDGKITPIFNAIFQGVINSSTIITLQDSEVSEVKWFELSKLQSDINNKPENFTPGLIDTLSNCVEYFNKI